jgi:hypothetical protein
MDYGSFDALTSSLSGVQEGNTTRRGITRLLGGVALEPVMHLVGLGDGKTSSLPQDLPDRHQ